jgi:hypothetical protein
MGRAGKPARSFLAKQTFLANTLGRIRDICDRLSEIFQRLVPLRPDSAAGRKRPSAKDVAATSEHALQRFFEAAREERLKHGLGFIGRARVAFGLQQRLTQAGYPPPLVKQVLFAMLTSAFIGDNK